MTNYERDFIYSVIPKLTKSIDRLSDSIDSLISNNNENDEQIYRRKLEEYTYNDVVDHFFEHKPEYDGNIDNVPDEIICKLHDVANAYAFNGEYDCNLNYWANLDILMKKYGVI